MPHVCDTCGKTYPNGSDAMLNGCESCGSTTFQYVNSLTESTEQRDKAADSPQDIIDGDDSYVHPMTMEEDEAQRAAREEIIEPDELAGRNINDVESIKDTFGRDDSASSDADEEHDESSTETRDSPQTTEHEAVTDPATVRDELTHQFESIRILEPGEYELNLRGLYEQENRIIRVKEDGRYVIQLDDE